MSKNLKIFVAILSLTVLFVSAAFLVVNKPVADMPVSELIGSYFTPHNVTRKIILYDNNRFDFQKEWDFELSKTVDYSGSYSIKGSSIILEPNNYQRTPLVFSFYKDEGGNIYLGSEDRGVLVKE